KRIEREIARWMEQAEAVEWHPPWVLQHVPDIIRRGVRRRRVSHNRTLCSLSNPADFKAEPMGNHVPVG
ncbi:hypothetical protein ACFL0Q_07540, partial [Thermodesulfobacteriota bacterium]